MHSTTAMTAADVNAKNRTYWDGANGNVSSPADAAKPPMRVVTDRKVQVYDPYAHDEVMPTQSDPPDTRSDNLLERAHGGMDGWGEKEQQLTMQSPHHGEGQQAVGPLTKAQQEIANKAAYGNPKLEKFGRRFAVKHHPENDNAVEMYQYGHEVGENLAHGEIGDDLIEGSEAGPVEGQADSDIQERTMRKQNNMKKVAQNAHPEVRKEFAEMQREVRANPEGRGKAAAKEYHQFAKHEGEIERVTGTKKRPNNFYNSVSGQRRMPG
jgi:hypothetical protein